MRDLAAPRRRAPTLLEYAESLPDRAGAPPAPDADAWPAPAPPVPREAPRFDGVKRGFLRSPAPPPPADAGLRRGFLLEGGRRRASEPAALSAWRGAVARVVADHGAARPRGASDGADAADAPVLDLAPAVPRKRAFSLARGIRLPRPRGPRAPPAPPTCRDLVPYAGAPPAPDGGGAPPAAEGRGKPEEPPAKPSVKLKKKGAVRKKSAGVLGGVAASIKDLVADLSNVFLLYSDLNHLGHNFDDALRSLAYVEHCVPKIVSALEMLQSIVQIILKAVQGVSFPPNPAIIVDLMHTSRRVMKQASSIYDVYKAQPDLAKSVALLSAFALRLVDAIARTAKMLKDADLACCCSCGPCAGMQLC